MLGLLPKMGWSSVYGLVCLLTSISMRSPGLEIRRLRVPISSLVLVLSDTAHSRGRMYRIHACRARCRVVEEAWITPQIGTLMCKTLLDNIELCVTFQACVATKPVENHWR